MRFLLAPLLALCLMTNASAQVSQEDNFVLSQEQLFDTVCRVEVQGPKGPEVGSGFVFAEDESMSYIMTCYHVVEDKQATVRFQRDGFMSDPIPVDTVYASYNPYKRDLAILALEKQKLGGIVPRVLPLKGENVDWGTHKIYTVGHANGSLHPSMFLGTIVPQKKAGLHFSPPPKGGRSGSPIIGVKDSTGERFAIGLIGWRNEETNLGKAMSTKQIYAVLRGEDVALGTPINDYQGVPVQYYDYSNCPNGKCPTPFGGFFSPKQQSPQNDIVNPNNPWIKTPIGNAPVVVGPSEVDLLEKRIAAVEKGVKNIDIRLDNIAITADSVKDQLAKLGITIDTRLKNYATRDSFGNYVTKTELQSEARQIVDTVATGVTTEVDKKLEATKTELTTAQKELEVKTDGRSERLDKMAKTVETISPFLAFIPGWGTLASGGGLALAGGLYDWSRRRKKKVAEQVEQENALNARDARVREGILSLVTRQQEENKVDESVIEANVAEKVKAELEAEKDKTAEENARLQQLEIEHVTNLIRQEIAHRQQATPGQVQSQPESKVPAETVPAEPQFVAPVQHFHEQPPRPYNINYTVAPQNNDELYFRQAMEDVSARYPEAGRVVKLIEAAYPIFKSGVR